MPIARCNSHLGIPAPPPSPIPTGRGSRCAANEIFSEYVEKTLQLPELMLPEHQFHEATGMGGGGRPVVPAEIDYWRLAYSVDLVLESAKEFGAFRINGHGISGQELGTVVDEAECIFAEAMKTDARVVERNRTRGEMIPCVRSRKGTLEFTAPKFFGAGVHRNFWKHMENIARRLDRMVELVNLALQEDTTEEFKERLQETENVISLCRYRHDNGNAKENKASNKEKNDTACALALRFYLPMEHCIFYLQSERGPLSFDAGPETIVVTIGKQIEEWSLGKFKCVPAEMIFMASFYDNDASFSIELNCSSTNPNQNLNPDHRLVSLTDQILVAICFCFLYKFLYFIFYS
ncbi:hypothetical protein L6164_000182 [Bauhinia variegata]|uniref:Uncharacterized protein n=1 Tax=Bauhinia variegata TaxID=167791 RepID=A0ACB9QBA5_BAUVA|nr:hypothetical protein L6164_000182 [Bauhinia variegata]